MSTTLALLREKFDAIKTCRVLGTMGGFWSMGLGLYFLIAVKFHDPKTLINAIYQVIFGLLMVICEMRFTKALTSLRFLTHFLGLGLFYIFVAGLNLGKQPYQFVLAIILLVRLQDDHRMHLSSSPLRPLVVSISALAAAAGVWLTRSCSLRVRSRWRHRDPCRRSLRSL